MSKFFVPTSWENLVDAIKFRPSKATDNDAATGAGGSDNAGVSGAKNTKNKTKNKLNKKANADCKLTDEEETSSRTSLAAEIPTKKGKTKKLANGRVEKASRKQQKKLTTAMAKATAAEDDGASGECCVPMDKQNRKTKAKAKRAQKKKNAVAADSEMQDADAENGTTAHNIEEENSDAAAEDEEQDIGLSVFAAKLKERLLGGRFRYINEQLYNMDSQQAEEFFSGDAEAFDAYHAGYRQQVEQWPLNPLDRVIKMIKRLPKAMVIADFGCGEGRLAKSVPNKVYSLDLVSTKPHVIPCDMANTPLHEQSVDVVVYCLSLMGTNLKDYLLEANRVLRMCGLVIIAEIQSRFEDLRQFVHGLEACGFALVKKDCSAELFYYFQFKKVRNVGKVAMLPAFSLKPCLYRKR